MGDLDGEVVRRALAEAVDDEVPPVGVDGGGDLDVGGHGHQAGGDRRDVEVVDAGDPRNRQHVLAHLRQLDPVGGPLHEDRDGLAQQPQRPRRHEGGDEQGGDGVGAAPPRRQGAGCGGDHRDRAQGVVGDLQERGAHIEGGAPPSHEDEQGSAVGDQADGADDQHGDGLDGPGRYEAPHRLPRDDGADDRQHPRLQGGRQHLRARPPPRVAVVAGPGHQVGRDQGDHQPGGVHRHMARVRRQRQGTGHVGGDELGGHDARGDPERHEEPRARGAGVVVRVAAVGVPAASAAPLTVRGRPRPCAVGRRGGARQADGLFAVVVLAHAPIVCGAAALRQPPSGA